MSAPFRAGERALLIDQRGRRYVVKELLPGEVWHSHGGGVPHDLVIGASEGVRVRATSGMVFTCFRPTLVDFVLKMPRGAQVVYPKDLGAILIAADVHPGARVLEAGTGSGALTIALCRAVGPVGRVVSYEVRDEFRRTATENVEAFFGKLPEQLELRAGDVAGTAGTDERFDRIVLDLPEPWILLDAVGTVLEPGGIVCAYLPTTVQVQDLVLALGPRGYEQIETFEVLQRSWHVTERSVRPDHRMVAHTGFITTARRTSGSPVPPGPEPRTPS